MREREIRDWLYSEGWIVECVVRINADKYIVSLKDKEIESLVIRVDEDENLFVNSIVYH